MEVLYHMTRAYQIKIIFCPIG